MTKNLFSHAVLLPLRSLRSRLRAFDVHQLIRKVSEVRGRPRREGLVSHSTVWLTLFIVMTKENKTFQTNRDLWRVRTHGMASLGLVVSIGILVRRTSQYHLR